jgi:hypothetical protein
VPQGVKVQVLSRAPIYESPKGLFYFAHASVITASILYLPYMERPLSTSNEIFDPAKRLDKLQQLRVSLDLPELSIEPNKEDHATFPSIGIEIEMTWDQALEDLRERWLGSPDRPEHYPKHSPVYQEMSQLHRANDARLRPVLEMISRTIPRVGFDAYWEFSFQPTRHTTVLDAEVQTLYDANILVPDVAYATHMTIAGIPNARDAFAIACLLEQAGGSTPGRIERAIVSKKGAWAQKGTGGVLKRYANELVGDDTVAYEFRTLLCTSPEQMSALHRIGQDAAWMSIHDPARWKAIRADIEHELKAHNLPLEAWGTPKIQPEIWRTYSAQLLGSAALAN